MTKFSDFTGTKIVLLLGNRTVVYLRDNKPDLPFPNMWDFPGGGREGDESPIACGIREVHEEFGIRLAPSSITYKKAYPSRSNPNALAHFMVAHITAEQAAAIVFGNEGQRWDLMNIEAVLDREDVVPHLKDRFRDYLRSRMTPTVEIRDRPRISEIEADISIVRACAENLAKINALIVDSKSYWQWPEKYLEKALPLLAVVPEYLARTLSFEVWRSDQLVAFFSIELTGKKALLDNLWVAPEYIGQGIGRRVCEFAFALAHQECWSELAVLPDPPSEGFYAKVGFADTGERRRSRVPGGPHFSLYRMQFAAHG